MNIKRLGVLLGPTLLLTSLVTTTDAMAEWTGGVEGGQVIQGDQKGSRVRFKLSNSDRPFSQAFYADWIRGEENSNGYEVGYTPRYWFGEQTYAFGEGSLKTSKALSIDKQIRALLGVGIQLIDNKTQNLYAEVGAGQLSTEYDTTLGLGEDTVTSGIATARLGATQTLSDLLKLELDADYSTADDLVQSTAEAGISLKIPGGAAIKYSHRYRSVAIGDADATSVTDSSVSFNYGF